MAGTSYCHFFRKTSPCNVRNLRNPASLKSVGIRYFKTIIKINKDHSFMEPLMLCMSDNGMTHANPSHIYSHDILADPVGPMVMVTLVNNRLDDIEYSY